VRLPFKPKVQPEDALSQQIMMLWGTLSRMPAHLLRIL
jgi:hypothetical protein